MTEWITPEFIRAVAQQMNTRKSHLIHAQSAEYARKKLGDPQSDPKSQHETNQQTVNPENAAELAQYVQKNVRLILSTAQKFQIMAKRDQLNENDILNALHVHNAERIIGPIPGIFVSKAIKQELEGFLALPVPDTPESFEFLKSVKRSSLPLRQRYEARSKTADLSGQLLVETDRQEAADNLSKSNPSEAKKVAHSGEFFYKYQEKMIKSLDDLDGIQQINITDIVQESFPRLDTILPNLRAHWLSIKGEQPAIPENPYRAFHEEQEEEEEEEEEEPSSMDMDDDDQEDDTSKFSEQKVIKPLVDYETMLSKIYQENGLSTIDNIVVRPRVIHSVPEKLLEFFKRSIGTIFPDKEQRQAIFDSVDAQLNEKYDSKQLAHFAASIHIRNPHINANRTPLDILHDEWLESARLVVLNSIKSTENIQPLVPYLIDMIGKQYSENSDNEFNATGVLSCCIRLARAILGNSSLRLEPWLIQLLDPLLSIVCRFNPRKSTPISLNIRSEAGQTVAYIFRKYAPLHYSALAPRILDTYIDTLFEPKTTWAQKYGALFGLHSLGDSVIENILFRPETDETGKTDQPPNIIVLSRLWFSSSSSTPSSVSNTPQPMDTTSDVESTPLFQKSSKPQNPLIFDRFKNLCLHIIAQFHARHLKSKMNSIREYAETYTLPNLYTIYSKNELEPLIIHYSGTTPKDLSTVPSADILNPIPQISSESAIAAPATPHKPLFNFTFN